MDRFLRMSGCWTRSVCPLLAVQYQPGRSAVGLRSTGVSYAAGISRAPLSLADPHETFNHLLVPVKRTFRHDLSLPESAVGYAGA